MSMLGEKASQGLKKYIAFLLCAAVGSLWLAETALAMRPIGARLQKGSFTSDRGTGTVAGSCSDNDGDGYGSGNCLGPDCDDNNADVNPGASEECNGVDDDCDGSTDEDFTNFTRDGDPNSANFNLFANIGVGGACIEGFGICARFGTVVCVDSSTADCNAVPGTPEQEGPPGDPSCFDHLDNDCDGLVDHGNPNEPQLISACLDLTDPEPCNGFDDNNNGEIDEGLGLGDPCTVGVGQCANTAGTIVCDGNGGTKCNAQPLPPIFEDGPLSVRCTNGIDDDCDGLTDLNDPGCQEPEKCDGIDNDGNNQIDETFTDLGELCTAGVGPCQAFGVKVCSGDKLGTVCTAVPNVGSPEGPSGITCTDGIDNDCDGNIDGEDTSCGAAGLVATCSLPYIVGKPGSDCNGKHRLIFGHNGNANTTIQGELMALNVDGSVLAVLPVKSGEEAHLASRLSPKDWKWSSMTNSRGTRHEVFAPVPMLRVIAQNGDNRAEAYCSNIPYLEVFKPSNTVVSQADAETPVFAAIPLVDPASLTILVDGVDILQDPPIGLGLNPATVFPGGPYSGTVDINGSSAQITELRVSSGAINVNASNTISFNIAGLGCGSHVVTISGQRRAGVFQNPPTRPAAACYLDDLTDSGTSMVFMIEITKPVAGEVVGNNPASVNVEGEACHGMPIAAVNINGFPVDVSGQVHTPGGANGGDVYTVPIDVDVPVTNLRSAVDSNGGLPGSFDPGSNRLIAQAVDGDFNATYDSFFFAVGPIVPGPLPATSSARSNVAADPSEVERAFVLAITTDGAETFFDALKEKNKKCLGDTAKQGLKEAPTREKKLDIECDPPVKMVVNNTELSSDQFTLDLVAHDSVTADPREGTMDVTIGLPPVDITAHFTGYCESGCVCAFGGCACAVCVTVDVHGRFNQKNMKLSFTVDRAHMLQSNLPRDQREKLQFNFDIGESDPNDYTHISGEVDVGCLLGFIFDVLNFFGQVITFGLWDPGLGTIEFEMTADQMVERFQSRDGDPMDTEFVKFKNDELPDFGTRQKDSRISDVAIGSTGLAVAIGAGFAPDAEDIDPEAADIPGTPLKNAPIPIPPIFDQAGQPVEHVTIAISTDVFNQLFYSMVQTGKLKTEFEVNRQLGSLIPANCAEIGGDPNAIDSNREARCVGFRGGDCTQFPLGSEFRRQCRRGSRIDRNTNIGTGTNIILHGQVHNPPIILLDDDGATPEVEVTLRYPQISLHLIADRANNQILDTGDLASTPMCSYGDLDADFQPDSTATSDCILWEFCMTIDLNLTMQFEVTQAGRERLKFNFVSIERDTPFGVPCNGSADTFELDFLNSEAGRTETFDILEDKLRDGTPPLEHQGLELGGAVKFTGKRIVAIETDNNPDGFQDYIGITGEITPQPVDPNAGCEDQ